MRDTEQCKKMVVEIVDKWEAERCISARFVNVIILCISGRFDRLNMDQYESQSYQEIDRMNAVQPITISPSSIVH